MTLTVALADLRAARQATIDALGGLDPAAIAGAASWRGSPVDLRFLLLRLADDDLMRRVRLERALRAAGHQPSEAQQILGAARVLHGRIAGALIGVTDAQFDARPANGEWPVRRVIGHLIANDTRYLIHVQHSVARARAGGTGPMRPDPSTMPDNTGEAESTGTMADVLARFAAGHDQVLESLHALSDIDLEAPTTWTAYTLDVRFRLFRFAEHNREHLLHLEKSLAGIGFRQSEPQRLINEAIAARAALEAALIGVPDGTEARRVAEAALGEYASAERESVVAIFTAIGRSSHAD